MNKYIKEYILQLNTNISYWYHKNYLLNEKKNEKREKSIIKVHYATKRINYHY